MKGHDRANLTKLQDVVKVGGQNIVLAFLHNNMLPWMGRLSEALKQKSTLTDTPLDESSCLSQLQNGICGGSIIENLKEFCVFLKEIALIAGGVFCKSEDHMLDAAKSQTWLRRWQTQSQRLLKAIKSFENTPDGLTENDTVLMATL